MRACGTKQSDVTVTVRARPRRRASISHFTTGQAAAVGWATWDVGYEGTATLARRRHGVANAVAHCCTARCLWHTSHPDEPSITLSTQHLATAIYPREEKAAAASRVVSSIHL